MEQTQQQGDSPGAREESPGKPRQGRRRFVVRLLKRIAVFYIIWCAALFLLQDWLIFASWVTGSYPRQPIFEGGELVQIDIDDGQVDAWLMPTENASAAKPAPAVIFHHGNAETVGTQRFIVDGYRELGVTVLLVEYRNFGHSDGSPSQQAIIDDILRFHDLLVERPEVDPDRIIIHGRSLGGGFAVQLAGQRTPTALIIESTFTSLETFPHRFFVPRLLLRHPMRSEDVIPDIDAPILILHGNKDRVIPIEQGKRLHGLAEGSTFIELDCAHTPFPCAGEEQEYWQAVESHLRNAGIFNPDYVSNEALTAQPETSEHDQDRPDSE